MIISKKTGKINIVVLLIVITALLLTSVGVTLAYLAAKTPTVVNEFVPTSVSCLVEEQFEDGIKSQVKVRNTGDVTAYIRAAVVVTWVRDSDGAILSRSPIENKDYTLIFENQDWSKGADGYYYYKYPVTSGAATHTFISHAQTINQLEGYSLSIQILASALQYDPPKAVEESWGVTVKNGNLIVQ